MSPSLATGEMMRLVEGHREGGSNVDVRLVQSQIGVPISTENPYMFLLADVEEALSCMPHEPLFDLVVTSPPYNIGKEYESKKDLGEYLEWQGRIIDQLVPRLREGGSLCWQVGNFVENGGILPLALVFAPLFSGAGLKLRNRIVWHFGHGLHNRRRFSGRYEVVLWYTKSDTYTFNLDAVRTPSKYPGKRHFKGPRIGEYSGNPLGKNPGDVWEIPNVKANHIEKTMHPCQFPVGLVERLVLALTNQGDLVFDPFAGVGSTGVASALHGRRFWGVEVVPEYLANYSTAVFLDESHRIKGGQGVTAQTVLSMSHLPQMKLVLSGTPMPQHEADLLPQFSFLFPEVDPRDKSPVSLVRPIYVRTTKSELGLRPPDHRFKTLPMNPLQIRLYALLRHEASRQAAGLNLRSRREFRQLGRTVMRLMQFTSNPALLAEELGAMHPELMRAVIKEGDGPKLSWTCERVRRLVGEDKKVIVWSSFVRNVELIAARLSDLGTEFIHGGVESGDDEEFDTREAKIKRFHDASMVLVANPAAAAEGISLHDVCHHAIFLDRSFNAAHFMQAEDRIHRLGLSPDQSTTIEIVECENSIDDVIRLRLNAKVARMARALNDPSLSIEPLPFDDEEMELEETGGLSEDDIDAVMSHLQDPRWFSA